MRSSVHRPHTKEQCGPPWLALRGRYCTSVPYIVRPTHRWTAPETDSSPGAGLLRIAASGFP
jgi:hypothetical protein